MFFRGYTFCKLLSMFAKGYNETTKNTDLGIPLRLSSDFNDVSVRSNVGSSYDQVVSDLKIAARLLSAERPQFTERPSKRAAFGALAEVYLVMHQYQQAKLYADSCLLIAGDLMDYNQFDVTSSTPFPVDNDEVIINVLANRRGFSTGSYSVDTTLYKSYDDMDLRRDLFFRKVNDTTYAFKGSYFQPSYLFTGIATDEIYLIRAECNARAGNLQDAVEDLNTLLAKRYVTGSFTPYEVVGASELLSLILNERRKELVFRDLRWSDIKRLNLDGEVIDITRVINGSPKVLKANDNRFALAIPNREINISGMKQNPR